VIKEQRRSKEKGFVGKRILVPESEFESHIGLQITECPKSKLFDTPALFFSTIISYIIMHLGLLILLNVGGEQLPSM
jgi:hypothetical protein